VGVGLEGVMFVFVFVGGVGVEESVESLDGISLVEVDVEGDIENCLFDTEVDDEGPRAGVDVPELPFFRVGRADDSGFAVRFAAAAATTLSRLPPPTKAVKSGAEDNPVLRALRVRLEHGTRTFSSLMSPTGADP
jgi:hypothetical protein